MRLRLLGLLFVVAASTLSAGCCWGPWGRHCHRHCWYTAPESAAPATPASAAQTPPPGPALPY